MRQFLWLGRGRISARRWGRLSVLPIEQRSVSLGKNSRPEPRKHSPVILIGTKSLDTAGAPLEHFFEFLSLIGSKLPTNRFAALAHFFTNVLGDQAVEKPGPFLALADKRENFGVLFGGQTKFLSHPLDKFGAQRAWLKDIIGSGLLCCRN